MIRMMADVGNSRLKWGQLREGPTSVGWDELALSTSDPAEWDEVRRRWGIGDGPSSWAISSVAPRTTESLLERLEGWGAREIRLFRSGRDVPVPNELDHPETSGADRALGVLGALQLPGTRGLPGFVISCGSAITVDRVSRDGVWTGGAIAPGLALASETLHLKTAQLPRVHVTSVPRTWGSSTIPAIEAGVFWGCVGGIRELVTRQSDGYELPSWIVWTGGDARLLSDGAAFPSSRWMPGLVLSGLKVAMGW